MTRQGSARRFFQISSAIIMAAILTIQPAATVHADASIAVTATVPTDTPLIRMNFAPMPASMTPIAIQPTLDPTTISR